MSLTFQLSECTTEAPSRNIFDFTFSKWDDVVGRTDPPRDSQNHIVMCCWLLVKLVIF